MHCRITGDNPGVLDAVVVHKVATALEGPAARIGRSLDVPEVRPGPGGGDPGQMQ